MALDTRIPLLSQPISINDIISNAAGMQSLIGMQQAQRQAEELAPIEKRLRELQLAQGEEMMSPEAIQQRNLQRTVQNLSLRDQARIADIVPFAKQAKSLFAAGDMEGLKMLTEQRMADLQARKEAGEEVDDVETASFLRTLEKNPKEAEALIDQILQLESVLPSMSAPMREFAGKAAAAGLEPGTPEYEQAARIDLGLSPRAATSAQERIATSPELTTQVAESQAQIKGAEEASKLGSQLAIKPKIEAAVKEAELAAKNRGETLSEYGKAKAALPGLKETVDKLKTLSDVATYTLAGRAFDTMAKELGFGATKGATARAKIESLVDNQVLPLLKQTFGSAFTEAEGERLRNTMIDINASPDQKKAILDSFIEQKMSELQAKESELGMKKSSFTSTGGITFTVE